MVRARVVLRGLLLTAVVAASGFLSWWSWRTSSALAQLGERSVVESTVLLVREKIDRIEATVIAGDNAVLHLVNPDDLDALAQRWPDLAERISPVVRAVLVLDHAQRPLRLVTRRADDDRRELEGWVTGRLRSELHLATDPVGGLRHWHGSVDGRSVLLSVLTRESAGRRYHVVVEADLAAVQGTLIPRLFDDPLVRGRFAVTDEGNRLVLGTALGSAREFVVSTPFPTTLYKWRLAVSPRQAPELEARARRRGVVEGSYVALSLLVILAGVSFLLFAARQEERLNTLKSDFIATVSHELKTPLSLIRMFAEMLASNRAPTPEKRQQYLDILVRESERLSSLIENVLDFARLEQGRTAYEFVPSDLAQVLRRDADAFRVRLPGEGPLLALDLSSDLRPVRLDARAMQVLLFNLLDNAFKYAKGTDAVIIRARQDGARAVVEVEDHGPGIDAEDARRVFERFYRGRAVRSGGPRGTGIGLSLVQHIARAHGGDVSLHAAWPKGTVFRVTLPSSADA